MSKSAAFKLLFIALSVLMISVSRAAELELIQSVVLISIDGLRADSVNSKTLPLLDKRLRQSGSYSLKARNVLPSTTLPNHASMLTGLDPDHHHVKFNYHPDSRLLGFLKPQFNLPTIFSVVRSQGGTTAAFIAKKKLAYLFSNASSNHLFIEEEALKENYIHGASSRMLVDKFIQTRPQAPYTFTFFHFSEADSIGHTFGWMSAEYLQVLKAIDHQLNRLLEIVVQPNSAIIITSDHGGNEKHHEDDKPQNRTMLWAALLPGTSIGQDLNSPISIIDTTPTIASLLGLEWPDIMQGRIINLMHE